MGYSVKAVGIGEIAETILREYDGDLNRVLNLPLHEVRDKLMGFPGVGGVNARIMRGR
ncbi:MAG: hypothetical protein ACE5GD_06790 [Candidatus Geothermarchaeales archaeon]